MPIITPFGREEGKDDQQSHQGIWLDIDISDPEERVWLTARADISDHTKALLLEPVRFGHREHLSEGMFLSLRTMRTGETDDIDQLADLKILIGGSQAITVRTGEVVAVDELRQFLRRDRSLVTPMDLLGFMISGLAKRLEAVIFDLGRDTDAVEDQWLDSGYIPSVQTLNEQRRRLIRIQRQLSSAQQLLSPIATDPALTLDADDRETLVRSADHISRYLKMVENCGARIRMLEEQIQAQRATAMTRSSLNLTIVATVFLPLTFIAGLLGMNVAGIPNEHNPWAFWVVSGVMIIIGLVGWWLLRRRMRI